MKNLLLATEIIKDCHKDSITPRCAMKIGISKAFDSVQWSFLLTTLRALDFLEQYVLWIKTCITTASFSVQVNGELAGYFGIMRGLRQVCSLSPYLFVISMNVLSRKLDMAADDLMVFVRGDNTSIQVPLGVFDVFATHSGLRISLEKSTLYMAGVSQACIHEIDKLCSAFLWSGPALNVKKAKVAWSEVCLPKSEGGLGLRSLEEANKLSVLKLIWRLLSAKGSLWVDWVKRYLIRSGSLWAEKESKAIGSWICKKLLKYRDITKQFHKVEVKNWESTTF
ncbi:PREDICTED: uncharacterized protein LOC109127278 [Camelina sativa]|uniref:Uncharacterized protein LOC109127278 n=1 Tax=Camelina sativa TaxID=90675 RepID=A0ABM1QKW6_CAMSA|nr:PREDICTED: uncharacterized protein LOC109127278 [Camelina sativa]